MTSSLCFSTTRDFLKINHSAHVHPKDVKYDPVEPVFIILRTMAHMAHRNKALDAQRTTAELLGEQVSLKRISKVDRTEVLQRAQQTVIYA